MNKTNPYPSQNSAQGGAGSLLHQRGLILGLIMLSALIGFEMFNYSTTEYALADILGEIRFAGIRWATILALAFCGIDFAGIARLFLPENSQETGRETWFLFGAWLLAAALNAMLTWWGVSIALTNHAITSSTFVEPGILSRAVPIFIAVMVWVTRILLISAFSSSGLKLFAGIDEPDHVALGRPEQQNVIRPRPTPAQRIPPANQPARAYASPRQAQDERKSLTQTQPRPATGTPRPQPVERKSPAQPKPAVVSPRQAPNPPPSRPMPQPAPKIAPKPDDGPAPEENIPPEPEYIPDPYYHMPQPAYHSLTAKSNGNPPQARKF